MSEECGSRGLLVAVLAGGAGSRIGGAKPLRLLGGESLIARAIGAARHWSPDVMVVARAPDQVAPIDVPFVPDAPGAEGPIAGLAAALRAGRAAGHRFVLTIPCDTPFLPADLAPRLEQALTDQAGAAIASSGGRLHPACALWRIRALPAIGPYLASGRASLRGFAAEIGFVTADWPIAGVDPFLNINNAEELAAAQALVRPA